MKYQNANADDILPEIRELLKEQQYTQPKVDAMTGEEIGVSKHLKKGLFLKGITGSGKTHTLYAVRSVVANWGKATRVENWVKLLYEMRKDNFSKTDSIINQMIESQYIFIDDIGAEKMSEWNEEILYMIINEAYTNERNLFITTNLSDEDFLKKYGERLVSRISSMCLEITMPEKDRRTEE